MKPDRRSVDIRLLIFVGGAIGTLLRVLIGRIIATGGIPWDTLTVNVLGSLGLGVLVGRTLTRPAESSRIPFLGVGVMGALTTFGGVMTEFLDLGESGRFTGAIVYAIASVGCCLLAALVTLRVAAER